MPIDKARTAFGPEALSRFTQILEEVSADLVADGLSPTVVGSNAMRTRLAQKLLSFARSRWTDTQIKQLLLRKLRNEASASRYPAVADVAPSAEQNAEGLTAMRSAYLGVDPSQAIWRKPVEAAKVDRD
jgi:hypothetical protein